MLITAQSMVKLDVESCFLRPSKMWSCDKDWIVTKFGIRKVPLYIHNDNYVIIYLRWCLSSRNCRRLISTRIEVLPCSTNAKMHQIQNLLTEIKEKTSYNWKQTNSTIGFISSKKKLAINCILKKY